MSVLRFVPLHEWSACGQVFVGGETVEITRPTAELRRAVAAAESAGVLVDVDGHTAGHVQTQADGEAAHEAARASGDWGFGQSLQSSLDRADRLVERAQAAVDEANIEPAQDAIEFWQEKKTESEIDGSSATFASSATELLRAQDRLAVAEAVSDEDRAARAARLELANENRKRVDADVQKRFAKASK